MNRRKFIISLASYSTLLATPALATLPIEKVQESAPLQVSDEIKALEAFVKRHPNPFPWDAHNELRHLYGAISETKSMWHADLILAHSFMDDYMLSILSNWQLESDAGIAVVNLLSQAERHPSLAHVRAACLMKAGDVCQQHNKVAEANRLYQAVALQPVSGMSSVGVKRYVRLAHLRLSV
jgi:hypothetical protein